MFYREIFCQGVFSWVVTYMHLEKQSIFEKDGGWFIKNDRNGCILLPSGLVSPLYLVAALKNR